MNSMIVVPPLSSTPQDGHASLQGEFSSGVNYCVGIVVLVAVIVAAWIALEFLFH